ncbi:probable DNA helicase MCM9 isoform X2 [Bradysia coprophila]|uniref:probable DNA helicase MCM9 isoform X2 n=1 Tax=Bradysia coprophila TaxID=38358 RepID=UPI00187DABEE|nr:probable DNA helicase MCM9 isoform X2 [Bradysia coprophila]
MELYLLTYHKSDIVDILNNCDDSIDSSISVNLTHLHQTNPELFTDVVNDIHKESLKWSDVVVDLQKRFAETDEEFLEQDWLIKENCRVRFNNLPEHDFRNRLSFPSNDDVGKFVQIRGTVLRTTQPKFLEYKTVYICGRCKNTITIEGDYGKYYIVAPPNKCPNGCTGRPYSDTTNAVNKNFITYQEIKIMEAVSKKSTPSVMDVTLDDDLVESCQPGDSVTICGTVESRYTFGQRIEIKVVVRANSVNNKMKQVNIGNELPEHLLCLRAEWNEFIEKHGELGARDMIVQSICPDVHGMYLAKLAVALAICSGSSSAVSGMRNHSHVLLIGDPGLAKSRLLKFASAVSTRCSFATGSGVSSAGLTAAAIQEGGEWQLEAGALPLADNGICCIDEFNMMSESDKASLHEAMEQQTIHISKAGIACKLNTRCTIIAATNPKNLYSMSDHEGTSAINLGLASSLLSRFDLVLILRDERNREWDTRVANHIFYEIEPTLGENLYDLARLQAHFSAVRDFDPVLTEGATRILKAYYLACRADEDRDAGRTTIRFNDSLYRLAKAHAKLLFRSEVTEIDAVIVVMLMESSFGFGRILQPKNVLHKDLPLGPSDDQIIELMDRLNLERINPPRTHNLHSTSLTPNLQLRADTTSNKENETINRRSETEVSNTPTIFNNVQERNTGAQVPGKPTYSKRYTVQKRQLNRSLSNENISILPAHYTQSAKTQPIEANPSTHHWKRFRMDLNDEELDQLFTLDEPTPKVNVVDRISNGINVPASVRTFGNQSTHNQSDSGLFTLDESMPKITEDSIVDRVSNVIDVPTSVRIFGNPSNDDELDTLFTLDEPTLTPTEVSVLSDVASVPVLNNSSNDDELDRVFTLDEPTLTAEINRVSQVTDNRIECSTK